MPQTFCALVHGVHRLHFLGQGPHLGTTCVFLWSTLCHRLFLHFLPCLLLVAQGAHRPRAKNMVGQSQSKVRAGRQPWPRLRRYQPGETTPPYTTRCKFRAVASVTFIVAGDGAGYRAVERGNKGDATGIPPPCENMRLQSAIWLRAVWLWSVRAR